MPLILPLEEFNCGNGFIFTFLILNGSWGVTSTWLNIHLITIGTTIIAYPHNSLGVHDPLLGKANIHMPRWYFWSNYLEIF